MTNFLQNIVAVLKRDLSIYATYATLLAVVATVLFAMGLSEQTRYFLYGGGFSLITLLSLLALVMGFFFKLVAEKHPSPIKAFRDKILFMWKNPHEVVAFVLLLSATSFLFSAFTSLKSLIPELMPYAYDQAFADFDRWLHFGVDPWQITHAVFSHPLATGFINLMYNLWFFMLWGMMFFFILRLKPIVERKRYLIAHMLCWFIIGGFFATLMSSAGPVYYPHFVEDGAVFQPLMDRLATQNLWLEESTGWLKVWSLEAQQMLFNNYTEGRSSVASGISAMPSMHVSIAVLIALSVRHYHRFIAIAAWSYVAIIQIGSVHLGWHYAVDGYLAAFLTWVIWRGVHKAVKA